MSDTYFILICVSLRLLNLWNTVCKAVKPKSSTNVCMQSILIKIGLAILKMKAEEYLWYD